MKQPRFQIGKIDFSPMDVITTLTLALMLSVYGIVGYWWVSNITTPSSMVTDERIVSPAVMRAGGILTVDFTEYRYKTCTIQIGRYLRRVDRQPFLGVIEYLLQPSFKTFTAASKPRADNFSVMIPKTIPSGDYEILSRIRYFCNGLDYLWPRIMTTRPLALKVVP